MRLLRSQRHLNYPKLALYYAQFFGAQQRLRAVVVAQFAIDIESVCFYGAGSQNQPGCDLWVGVPGSQRRQYFHFPFA